MDNFWNRAKSGNGGVFKARINKMPTTESFFRIAFELLYKSTGKTIHLHLKLYLYYCLTNFPMLTFFSFVTHTKYISVCCFQFKKTKRCKTLLSIRIFYRD